MTRARLVSTFAGVLATAIAIGVLTQIVGAQTTVARPNVALTRLPTLVYSVLPADFNNDGKIDLVGGYSDGVYNGQRALIVRLGNGDGTFASRVIVSGLRPLAVGDFDADGNMDVLARDDGAVYVLRGYGDGTFGPPAVVDSNDPESAFTYAVVADFDGNGTLDFAKTGDTDAVTIYPGHGDLTFGVPASVSTDPFAHGIVATDLNHDGKIDIAVPTRYGRTVDVFLNQGALVFATSAVSLDRAGLGIAAADIDGDGVRDLLVSVGTENAFSGGFDDGYVYVLHGHGDGTFQQTASLPTNKGPVTVATGDFNRDGKLDIATGNIFKVYDHSCDSVDVLSDSVSILPGLGGGSFGAAVTFTLIPQTDQSTTDWAYRGVHHLLRTADVNGDGNLDLITSPGALLLNVPSAANGAPTATASGDAYADSGNVNLRATASDPDNDWLTFEWKDETGAVIGTLPQICAHDPNWTGTGNHTFTVTVRDGRGGVATSSWTVNFGAAVTNSTDVGAVSAAGSDSFDGTTYTLKGSGADIWGTADEFHYDYTTLSGDFDFSARVATVQNVNQWTKAGVMVRENATDAGSRHVSLFATPTSVKGLAMQWRSVAGGTSSSLAGPASAPPAWVRVVRTSDVVSTYYRLSDTASWVKLGSVTLTNLSSIVAVGLAVSSHVDGTLATATFDHVTLARVTSQLPPGWSARDIGNVGATGSGTFANDTFTVKGAGSDIWGTSDAFQYVATSHATDANTGHNYFEITARVTAVQDVADWTKAGLMLRSSDSPGAAHASLFITPAKGIAFQRRRADGQTSVNTYGPLITAPVWLKLAIGPSTVRAYYRNSDAMAWSLVGQDTIAFGSTIEAGLAVSSHQYGVLATSTFDHVSIRDLVPYGAQNIGGSPAGSVLEENGELFDVTNQGADIWGTSDQAEMLTTAVGSNGVSARVVSVSNTNAWTKAGVTIRDDTTPGSRHVSLFVTPGKGIAMQYRATANGTTAQVANIAGAAPRWIRLRRSGSTFTGEQSRDGMSWTVVGQINVSLSSTAIGGLIVTSHDTSTLGTGRFDDVILGDTGAYALLP